VAGLLLALVVLSVGSSAVLISLRLETDAARLAEANLREQKTREREQLTREALEKVEDTLAEHWMRPVGYDTKGLSPVELDPFRDLAGSPSERDRTKGLSPAEFDTFRDLASSPSERVRLRFLEKALEDPATAVRLGRRGKWAVQAVVGLDRQRHDRVVRLLLRKLQDEKTQGEVREACVLLGLALQTRDKDFCREGAKTAMERMGQPIDWNLRWVLARAVGTLAAHLPPEDAGKVSAAAVARLLDTLARTTDRHIVSTHALVVGSVTARLSPGEAAARHRPVGD
jgi:hypothetical protein